MMLEDGDADRLGDCIRSNIPGEPPDIIEWAEQNVKTLTSARSPQFDSLSSPWIIEPIRRAVDRVTRIVTLMKPVQTGGSTFGEVVLLYWTMFWRGFLQYNWSNDKRSDERWASRIESLMLNCAPVGELMTRLGYTNCEVNFGRIFFRMQGVFESHNLDSDTVSLQINEEVHDWERGHLDKARGRLTAVWNYKSLDISNAGIQGDQLDKAMCAGTHQLWEVRCPGCSNPHHEANYVYHRMRTRWDEEKPNLGGLRYDAEGCRVGFMDYNYPKLRPTIQYQMPCGALVHNEDLQVRRRLSSTGRYSQPLNKYAELLHRSYSYDSVCVDFIDWMELIKKKHSALKSRAEGDPAPWIKYTQEQECVPYHEDNIPNINRVEITAGRRKGREGLPIPRLRAFSLDRQQGERRKGELPYWWLLIRDFKIMWGVLRSVIVFEGKVETDEQAISIIDDHQCLHHHGCADSGDDTEHVYQFCYRYGIHAVKGGAAQWYAHDDNIKRSYGPEQPLHRMMNMPEKYKYVDSEVKGDRLIQEPDEREPMFWLYSRGAIAERLYWLQTNSQFEVAEDVSIDYKNHMDAQERVVVKNPRTGFEVIEWHKRKTRDDLLICERYCVMILDITGAMGSTVISDVETVDHT